MTIETLVNDFLNAKRLAGDTGELSHRSWNDYYRTCGKITKSIGISLAVEDLRLPTSSNGR